MHRLHQPLAASGWLKMKFKEERRKISQFGVKMNQNTQITPQTHSPSGLEIVTKFKSLEP